MRIETILIFLFVFHVSAAMVNTAKQYDYSMTTATAWTDRVGTDQLRDEEYITQQVTAGTSDPFGFGDFIKAFGYFVWVFALGIVWVPFTFIRLGIPFEIAVYFSLPVYMLYFIGIAQFIRGVPTTSMR